MAASLSLTLQSDFYLWVELKIMDDHRSWLLVSTCAQTKFVRDVLGDTELRRGYGVMQLLADTPRQREWRTLQARARLSAYHLSHIVAQGPILANLHRLTVHVKSWPEPFGQLLHLRQEITTPSACPAS